MEVENATPATEASKPSESPAAESEEVKPEPTPPVDGMF